MRVATPRHARAGMASAQRRSQVRSSPAPRVTPRQQLASARAGSAGEGASSVSQRREASLRRQSPC